MQKFNENPNKSHLYFRQPEFKLFKCRKMLDKLFLKHIFRKQNEKPILKIYKKIKIKILFILTSRTHASK